MTTIWENLLGAEVGYSGGRYRGRYVTAGEGEPLLLLHGQGGHIENFSNNIMPLAAHFQVFALDCVWHGLGPQPDFNPELLPVYIDQVLDFMAWRGIDSAHVAGQSMGGWTAMRLAHDHPDRVRKMVLTTVQGFSIELPGGQRSEPAPGPEARDMQLAFLENPTRENIAKRMVHLLAQPDRLSGEMIAIRHNLYNRPAVNASLRRVVSQYMGGPDSAPRAHAITEAQLKNIRAPALIYWSEKNSVPPAVGEQLAALIPNARYTCVADAGHWAQFEHADVHNAAVISFLNGG